MEYTQADFSGQHVYVGMDVSRKTWRLAVRVGQRLHKRFSQEPDPELLMSYLHRHFPGAQYHCVYEAGYEGFWSSDFDELCRDS